MMKIKFAQFFGLLIVIALLVYPANAQSNQIVVPETQPDDPMAIARLQIAHLAPFADPTAVDIMLDDVTLMTNVEYGDSTAYIGLGEGSYQLEIYYSGTTTLAISDTINLVGGNDYTAILIGDIVNQPLEILSLMDDNTAPAEGKFKLRLGHLAPFDAILADTTADVRLDDGTVLLDDVVFGDVAGYLELDAGTYDLKITTADGLTTLIDLAPVTFTAGQIVSAFAVGEVTNQPLGGFALPADAVGFFLPLDTIARLQVAHLAPFADPGTVDIELNGVARPELSNIDYGDSTAYIELDEDSYLVEIFLSGSVTPDFSTTVNLDGGNDYTAIAIGDEVNQPLDLLVLEDDNTAPAAGQFKLRLGHLAPFDAILADTTADVRLDDGTLLLDDVVFGDVAPNYLELDAGSYDLKITTPDGLTTLIDLAPVTFTAGQIVSAFAVGDGDIHELGGFALPVDTVGFFLPLDTNIARLQVAHLAPFADPGSVDIELNGTTLSDIDYGDSTAYIELAEGIYDVDIFLSGEVTPTFTKTVDLVGGFDYTAIAVGDIVNQPLDLLVLEDDNTPPAVDKFKLRLGHLAPFADTLVGTKVDVRLDDGTILLDDVVFGAVGDYNPVSDYFELDAGTYDLKITTPDGSTTLINLFPVTFTAGQIVSAFAVGDGDIHPLGGFALPADAVGFFLSLEYDLFLPLILR